MSYEELVLIERRREIENIDGYTAGPTASPLPTHKRKDWEAPETWI